MTDGPAEAIARVVADLRAGRVHLLNPENTDLPRLALDAIDSPTVVDCTAIYRSLVARDQPVYIYEDHPSIAPPWNEAAYGYVNEHGNAVVMHAHVLPDTVRWESDADHNVNWDDVRWRLAIHVWLGGRAGDGSPIRTMGPAHLWTFAIAADGTPLNLGWTQLLPDHPREHWDAAHLTVLGALNFLGCRNVSIVEPKRPRPERRRIARTGVTVHEINVFPTGRSTRSVGNGNGQGGVPLTSVRGHFAEYGPQYGKGLLFGKYEGRYWRPHHARGSADVGESQHVYRLQPSETGDTE